jgi:serine/threonine-protein kinase
MLQIGDQFDRFQILGHLAQGGMSDIYRAFDVVSKSEVTLKIPDQSMIGDPGQYERFQRELEVTNTLRHPAILRGLGSGNYNRTPFLATEFVDGKSLRALIEDEAPMPPARALALFRRIAEGVAYCHDNGVVHRDLKPENVLVRPDGQPVIIDFGLALTKGAHRVTYANLSATAGTPDYMAPEQIEGQRGDRRTDIYALGTILYEMLSGRTPYQGDNSLSVMSQHLHSAPPRLDRERPGVAPEVAAIVARCLLRLPDERYDSVGALMDALDRPEGADLSLLDRGDEKSGSSFLKSAAFKGIAISLVFFAVFIALAIILQLVRRG